MKNKNKRTRKERRQKKKKKKKKKIRTAKPYLKAIESVIIEFKKV
jgi:hypothetical protein